LTVTSAERCRQDPGAPRGARTPGRDRGRLRAGQGGRRGHLLQPAPRRPLIADPGRPGTHNHQAGSSSPSCRSRPPSSNSRDLLDSQARISTLLGPTSARLATVSVHKDGSGSPAPPSSRTTWFNMGEGEGEEGKEERLDGRRADAGRPALREGEIPADRSVQHQLPPGEWGGGGIAA